MTLHDRFQATGRSVLAAFPNVAVGRSYGCEVGVRGALLGILLVANDVEGRPVKTVYIEGLCEHRYDRLLYEPSYVTGVPLPVGHQCSCGAVARDGPLVNWPPPPPGKVWRARKTSENWTAYRLESH